MNRSTSSQNAGDWMREAVRSAITRLCASASIQAEVATGTASRPIGIWPSPRKRAEPSTARAQTTPSRGSRRRA